MALPLPRAAALLLIILLAAPLLCAAQEDPISPAPSPGGPAADGEHGGNSVPPSVSPAHAPAAPHDGEEKAPSPPAPTPTQAPAPALSSPHSPAATPAPAPAPDADGDNDGDDDDEPYKKKEKAPAPSPAAMMVKSDKGADEQQPQPVDGAERRDDGMSGGKKAGVVVGAFSAAAVVGLAAVVYRKRQANIRRSRYADYSARLELV